MPNTDFTKERPPTRAQISGLILAGGLATRMGGQDKGLVLLDGRPMIAHVTEHLRPQITTLVINCNRNHDRYRAYADIVVGDELPDFPGPLAGIQAGLRACPGDWVMIVPCDMPFLPTDVVEHLSTALPADAIAACAECTGQLQPLVLLLRRDAGLQSVTTALQQGERKVERWVRSLPAIQVRFDDADAFRNLNSPDELRR